MNRSNEIGRNITKLRLLKGWSQELMATKMQCLGKRAYEMTRQVLGNIECGRTNIYHWQIIAIHNVLGCSYDDIFLGPTTNQMPPDALFKKQRKRRRSKSLHTFSEVSH